MWQIRDIHGRYGQMQLVNFPFSGILRHKVYLRYFKGVRVVKPLDYIPYIKRDAMRLMSEKFGWQIYARKHFESRFTKFYEGYWLPVKFGFDTRRVQYSSMILTGQMTREEALADLAQLPYDEKTNAQDFEYISTKLGISVAELRVHGGAEEILQGLQESTVFVSAWRSRDAAHGAGRKSSKKVISI